MLRGEAAWPSWRATPGRATCASCATTSSAAWPWPSDPPLGGTRRRRGRADGAGHDAGRTAALDFKAARETWNSAFERRYLEELLDRHDGNVSAAARTAGIDRKYLYRLLWRHGLR